MVDSQINYSFRPYQENDRDAVIALGSPVIDWWHSQGAETSIHMVAVSDSGEVIADMQATDRSVPKPSRRPGQCHFSLRVAPDWRRHGIGSALYDCAEQFAVRRGAALLYVSYVETPDAPAASLLASRGFTLLERFLPSSLDLTAFDPGKYRAAIEAVEPLGIRLWTYAELGDSQAHRHKVYDLEQVARAVQPFREVEPYVPTPFATWEQDFEGWDQSAIFLAVEPLENAWVGIVTGLQWYFTGVHPQWQGCGIATALKVRCAAEAKQRGMTVMETENQEDNAAMLAINRKLGFVFGVPEVACIKRLQV